MDERLACGSPVSLACLNDISIIITINSFILLAASQLKCVGRLAGIANCQIAFRRPSAFGKFILQPFRQRLDLTPGKAGFKQDGGRIDRCLRGHVFRDHFLFRLAGRTTDGGTQAGYPLKQVRCPDMAPAATGTQRTHNDGAGRDVAGIPALGNRGGRTNGARQSHGKRFGQRLCRLQGTTHQETLCTSLRCFQWALVRRAQCIDGGEPLHRPQLARADHILTQCDGRGAETGGDLGYGRRWCLTRRRRRAAR